MAIDNGAWPPPSDEDVDRLIGEHGDGCYLLETSGEVLVVRTPTAGEFGNFTDASNSDARRIQAHAQLVRDCTLYPGRDVMADYLRRWPALAVPLANEIMRLARLNEQVRSKKLSRHTTT